MRADAPKYTETTRETALRMIQALRKEVNFGDDDVVYGTRFKNDESVMWILESNADEVEFLANPVKEVTDALFEAAKSDHWYAYEKDYYDRDEYDDDEFEEDSDDL